MATQRLTKHNSAMVSSAIALLQARNADALLILLDGSTDWKRIVELTSEMSKPAPAPVCDNNSINNLGSDTSLERLVGAQECDSRSAPDLEVESLYAKVVRHSRESPPGHGSELEFDRERDREDETVSSSTPTR